MTSAARASAPPPVPPVPATPAPPTRAHWAAATFALSIPLLVAVHDLGWVPHPAMELGAAMLALACVACLVLFLRPSLAHSGRLVLTERKRFVDSLEREALLRRRIAAELHDDLGQVVTGLQLSLGVIAARTADLPPELRPEVERAQRWVMRAHRASRALAHDLNALVLHEGLHEALDTLARELPHDLCRVTVAPAAVDALGPERAHDVHRVVQEAVTNAVRHGLATRIHVTLACTPDEVRLTVEDDGVGFVTGQVTPGLGLEGMRYRANRIGAVLTVHSTPDVGTRVVLAWPRPRAAA
jgi:signal transduction histidine kinase